MLVWITGTILKRGNDVKTAENPKPAIRNPKFSYYFPYLTAACFIV